MTPALETFRLVAASILWPPSARRVAAVRAAAAAGVDWAAVAAVARRHRVTALAVDGMRRAGLDPPPDLVAAARAEAERALFVAAETARLDRLLREAGLSPTTFKGAGLALDAYGDVGLRHSGDIDLLIDEADAPAAWAVLAANGYERLWPPGDMTGARLKTFFLIAKDSAFRHKAYRIRIDLHWRLSNSPRDAASGDRGLSVAGREVRTFDRDTQFVYLCEHAAHHAWMRLKWLADIAALLEQTSDGGAAYWSEDGRRGSRLGVEASARLAARLMGANYPPAFPAKAGWRVRLLTAMAMRALTAGGGVAEVHGTAYGAALAALSEILTARRAGPDRRDFVRLGFSIEDMILAPLPDALHGLYPLLRAPLWLWRRATGFRAGH
ncbi:MAG: nucleotidyltransferase family protein [Pseudomonadota bacterium]